MHFTTAIVALVAFVTYTTAATVPEMVNLFNGEGITSTPVGGIAERSVLNARNVCSGSPRCSNGQDLKNACAEAYKRLQGTTYTNGGDKSGVCAGHCGLFVEGSYVVDGRREQCKADLASLSNAFQAIQGQGCQTCGWVTTKQNSACRIKVDWVHDC